MITFSKLRGIITATRKQCQYTIKPPTYGRELSLREAEVVENEPATTYARRESQTPSFRTTQEQMGRKAFA